MLLSCGLVKGKILRDKFEIYQGESILIIGGAGFIGSHLAEGLEAFGAEIVVLDNLSNGNRDNLSKVDCRVIIDSIENADLEKIMHQHKIDRVFNLACGSLTDSLTNPFLDFNANVSNSFKCFESFRKYGAGKSFLYASTGSVYGEPESGEYDEDTAIRPSTPYGTSKACADLYAQLYSKFFSLPMRIVRFNNVYGPRKMGTAVPTFIESALNHQTMVVEGGEQIRTLTFVLDAVEATMLAALSERAIGHPLNISSSDSISVKELIHLIWMMVNGDEDQLNLEYRPYRPGEIMVLKPSVQKAKEILDWESRWSLKEGLNYLIKYIKESIS